MAPPSRHWRCCFQIVYPPISIRAEPYVAWVDVNVGRRGTLTDAHAYLEFLFGDAAQQIMANLGYRPVNPSLLRASGMPLPAIELFQITAIAHDWDDAQELFFAENGLMDGIMKEARP